MNIRTEQLEILRKQQELQANKTSTTQQKSGKDSFEATLAQQMSLGSTETSSSAVPLGPGMQTGLVNQFILGDVDTVSLSQEMTQQPTIADSAKAFDQASGALDMWESYVNVLGTPGNAGNLRSAYGILEGVEAQVATLKAESGAAIKHNPNLASIVNELDVLATTEKFKFNRGDYAV